MNTRHIFATVLAAGALLAPIHASAQQSQQAQPPAEVQEWLTEMQQIQSQLEPVQAQALQDSAVQEQQEALSNVVRAAMIQVDPSLEQGLVRMEQLIAEARVAQQASDSEKIVALTAEAQTLQPKIAQAQAQAMAMPEVQMRVTEFQETLQTRMFEIDPEARARLARLMELDERVRAAMGGM